MTWRSFLEYVTMRELGQEDSICRNYDLRYKPGPQGGNWITYAVSAAEHMKVDTRGLSLYTILCSVQAMLRNYGYIESDTKRIEVLLCEWYIWDRLKRGSLRRWKYKRQPNPLI